MSERNSRIDADDQPLVATLGRVVDFGIGGVLFLAPLAMAGRYEPGRLLLAVIVGITAVAWILGKLLSGRTQHWFWTGAEWIGLLSILLVALQLVPLSSGTLSFFSPEMDRILPMRATETVASANTDETFATEIAAEEPLSEVLDVRTGETQTSEVISEALDASATMDTPVEASSFFTWNIVSLAPHATRGGLGTAMIYVMLFFVVLQRCRHRADIERLIKGIAAAGVFMASIGIAQYLLSNGKFLWFMSHPSRDTLTSVKGTFANENHFAHFLALAMGPLLWWVIKAQGDARNSSEEEQPKFGSKKRASPRRQMNLPQLQVLLCIGVGIVFVAGLLTYSRGGLIVMTIAAMISTGLFLLQRRVGKRAVIAVCTAGLIAAGAVLLHGQDILIREIETMQEVSIDAFDKGQARRKIWTAVVDAVPDFAMLGSGVGSHRYVYPTYFSSKSSVQYTHAESGYLNVLLEAGGPGLGLLLVALGLSFFWAARGIFSEDEDIQFLAAPLVASLIISVLHAGFDFNWYIPANMCVTLIIVALCARLADLSKDSSQPRYRMGKLGWASLAMVVLAMSTFAISHYVGPARGLNAWHEYRAWSLASKRSGAGRRGELGNVNALDPDTVGQMIALLDEVVEYDPGHGKAHVRMASMCLRQFELLQSRSENPMSLAQIRDAALTSQFESHEAMSEWINRVVGENRVYLDRVLSHAKKGMQLTPTEGNAYLYYAEVAFLDPTVNTTEYELVEQAYAVRPYDATTQFSFGRHQLLAGQEESAMVLWKDAFGRGDEVRKRIIGALGFQVPPQQIVDLFDPGLEGMRDLFDYYRRNEFTPQMKFIGEPFVALLEKQAKLMSGKSAGKLWFEAQFVHAKLEHPELAAAAANNAVMADPGETRNHFACALRLRDCERFEEAADQFRWCAARDPKNEDLPKVIAEMKKLARRSKALSAQSIEKKRFQRR